MNDLIITTANESIDDIRSRTGGVADILTRATKKRLNIPRGGYKNTGFAYGDLYKSINYTVADTRTIKRGEEYKALIPMVLNMNDYGFALGEAAYKFGSPIERLTMWIQAKMYLGIKFYYTKNGKEYKVSDYNGARRAAFAMSASRNSVSKRVKGKRSVTNLMYKWYVLSDTDIDTVLSRVNSNLNLIFAKKMNQKLSNLK